MIRGKVAVDAMTIANCEHPVISNVSEVTYMETHILILFVRLVRDVPFLRTTGEVGNGVL